MEPSGVWCVCQGLLPGERTMRWTLPLFSSKWNHVVERDQRKKIDAAQLSLGCSFSFIAVVMLDRLRSLCYISRQTGRLHHDGDSDQNVPLSYIYSSKQSIKSSIKTYRKSYFSVYILGAKQLLTSSASLPEASEKCQINSRAVLFQNKTAEQSES